MLTTFFVRFTMTASETTALLPAVRMASIGDPEITRAKPLGYDTVSVLEELGYSTAAITELEASNQIHCFKGEVPASLDKISFGPDSQQQ